MFNEGCELLPERPRILLVEVDLVLHAADPEPHRLVCRASIEIVFQRNVILVAIPASLTAISYLYRTRSTVVLRQP